jgi:hypothetical protein
MMLLIVLFDKNVATARYRLIFIIDGYLDFSLGARTGADGSTRFSFDVIANFEYCTCTIRALITEEGKPTLSHVVYK